MAHTVIREIPDEIDKTLFLVMDGDNNLTAHPKTLDKIMEKQQTTEVRIIRLYASSGESDSDSGDEKPKPGKKVPRVNLTVEEMLPELCDDEGKAGDTSVPPDFVDPLSQLDTEAMQLLKKALASDQAKQLLGDNVTAMLDVLSVDDPAVFIQNSIKRDHCYTQLSPSADPKGPSFVQQKAHVSTSSSSHKFKAASTSNSDITRPSSSGSSQQRKSSPEPSVPAPPDQGESEGENPNSDKSESSDRSSDSDYHDPNSGYRRGRRQGKRGGRTSSGRGTRRRGRPPREPRPSRDSSHTSDVEKSPELSPTPVAPIHKPGKRGRPRKDGTRPVNPPTKAPEVVSVTAPVVPPPAAPIPPAEPSIDQAAAKALSGDAIRLGRPAQKSEEERKRDIARIIQKLDGGSGRGRKILVMQNAKIQAQQAQARIIETLAPGSQLSSAVSAKQNNSLTQAMTDLHDNLEEGEVPSFNKVTAKIRTYGRRDSGNKEASKVPAKVEKKVSVIRVEVPATPLTTPPPPPPPPVATMGGKYPRRENRKLPSHLADAIVSEHFLMPDAFRRKNTSVNQEDPNKSKEVVQKPGQSLLRKKEDRMADYEKSTATSKVVESITPETTPVAIAPAAPTLTDSLTELELMLQEGLIESEPNPVKEPTTETIRTGERVITTSESELITSKEETIVTSLKPPPNAAEKSKNELSKRVEGGEIEKKPSRPSRSSRDSNPELVKTAPVEASSSSGLVRTRKPPESQAVPALRDDKALDTTTTILDPTDGDTEADDVNKRVAVKRRRSDEVADTVGDSDDSDDALSEASWNSEDDPDKLWCICRKPHNNRFMICCDVCEEWFHGKCVGITKSIGRQMEQDGLEWSCPPCTKKKRAEEKEKEGKLIVKAVKPGDLKHTIQTKLSFIRKPEMRKCIMCSAPVRENSIYCGDQCIRKHSQRAIAELHSTKTSVEKPTSSVEPPMAKKEDRRVIVMDPNSKKVLTGPSAPTMSNLVTWLQQNPSFHVLYQKKPSVATDKANRPVMLKKIVKVVPAERLPEKTPTKSILGSGGLKAVSGPTKAVLASGTPSSGGQMKLTVSPNSKHIKIIGRPDNLQPRTLPAAGVAQKTPLKPEVESSPKPRIVESPKIKKEVVPTKRRRKEKLEVLQEFKSPVSTSKMDDTKDKGGESAIRESVRKTLGDALKVRLADAKDLNVKVDVVEGLATKIEERLYKQFENKVDVKYKSKYRSLVFNIKDQKNETLYRKILENAISPRELVRLSAEELASQELAQWREKENLHQLEMIKKTELELMTQGQTFIVKSRKGEEVIEKDTAVAAVAAEIDPNTSAKELVSALNSVSSTTPDNDNDNDEVKRKSETALMKMKKKQKESRRDRDKDRKHKRDRSRSRSRHSKSRRRSRSRSRDRHGRHRSRDRKSRSSRHSRDSRDKDKNRSKDKDKDRKEESKTGSDKKASEISTSNSTENKKESIPLPSDDADYEPTSTVTIKTPEMTQEEPEGDESSSGSTSVSVEALEHVWCGDVLLNKLADSDEFQKPSVPVKFCAKLVRIVGDCTDFTSDVDKSISVVGRIPHDSVWKYIAQQKKIATKDIIVVQILAENADGQSSFNALFDYLLTRSRIGVIGCANDAPLRDFYIYPCSLDSPVPPVLQPINIPITSQGDRILLGIIVRVNPSARIKTSKQQPTKPVTAQAKPLPAAPTARPKSLPLPPPESPPTPMVARTKKLPLPLPESPPESALRSNKLPLPETPPDTDEPPASYAPPMPSLASNEKKRKIRVHVALKSPDEDGDSPYEPASSDEDLPPLSKITKKAESNVEEYQPQPYKTLEVQNAEQIQKKIDEMNRAIEEQTHQIKTLASNVPLLPVIAPVLQHVLPAAQVAAAALVPPAPGTSSVPSLDLALKALQSIAPAIKESLRVNEAADVAGTLPEAERGAPAAQEIPLPPATDTLMEDDVGSSPPPPEVVEQPSGTTIMLPEVAQIAIPANLQAILASIHQAKISDKPEVLPASSPDIVEVPPDNASIVQNSAPSVPAPQTSKPTRKKLDRTAIFDNEFVGVKSKQIKFDLKLKAKESKDVDDRMIGGSAGDTDERICPVGTTVSSASRTTDVDERCLSGSRSVRSSDDDIQVIEAHIGKDQDDRLLPRRLDEGQDIPMPASPPSNSSTRSRRKSSDSDRRKSRVRDKIEDDWEDSIKAFEMEQRRRNEIIREKEIERLRRRSDSE